MVEHDESNEFLRKIKFLLKQVLEEYSFSEFLYHDTLHPHNDNQTVEEQLQEAHDLAKRDIDSLDALPNQIAERIRLLNDYKESIVSLLKEKE